MEVVWKNDSAIRKMAGVETTFETKPLLSQVRLSNSWKTLRHNSFFK